MNTQDHANRAFETLQKLKQNTTVLTFKSKFEVLAARASVPEHLQTQLFLKGLKTEVRNQVLIDPATHKNYAKLTELMDAALAVDAAIYSTPAAEDMDTEASGSQPVSRKRSSQGQSNAPRKQQAPRMRRFDENFKQSEVRAVAGSKQHFSYNATVLAKLKSAELNKQIDIHFPQGATIPAQVQKSALARVTGRYGVVGCDTEPHHNFRSCPVCLNYFQKHNYRLPNAPLTEAEASSLVSNCHHLHCMHALGSEDPKPADNPVPAESFLATCARVLRRTDRGTQSGYSKLAPSGSHVMGTNTVLPEYIKSEDRLCSDLFQGNSSIVRSCIHYGQCC